MAPTSTRWSTAAFGDEDELADAYEARKSFAYGMNGKAKKNAGLLQAALKDVDVAYQNLESVELGVTTVDHYFDTLGGISRAVKRAKGGKEAPSISATRPAARARCAPCRTRWRWRPARAA
jgi:magnesium chelatase subunit H